MIDYIFRFADEQAAKAAARAIDIVSSDWMQDHVLPNVKVTRISTQTSISGWFCIVATNNRVQILENSSALQVALDRDAAIEGRKFVLINNVGGILADIKVDPIFTGSKYPIGGYST